MAQHFLARVREFGPGGSDVSGHAHPVADLDLGMFG